MSRYFLKGYMNKSSASFGDLMEAVKKTEMGGEEDKWKFGEGDAYDYGPYQLGEVLLDTVNENTPVGRAIQEAAEDSPDLMTHAARLKNHYNQARALRMQNKRMDKWGPGGKGGYNEQLKKSYKKVAPVIIRHLWERAGRDPYKFAELYNGPNYKKNNYGKRLDAYLNPDKYRNSHVVQPGDTLGQIADRVGFSVRKLAEYNNIDNPDKIQTGQVIKYPGR